MDLENPRAHIVINKDAVEDIEEIDHVLPTRKAIIIGIVAEIALKVLSYNMESKDTIV